MTNLNFRRLSLPPRTNSLHQIAQMFVCSMHRIIIITHWAKQSDPQANSYRDGCRNWTMFLVSCCRVAPQLLECWPCDFPRYRYVIRCMNLLHQPSTFPTRTDCLSCGLADLFSFCVLIKFTQHIQWCTLWCYLLVSAFIVSAVTYFGSRNWSLHFCPSLTCFALLSHSHLPMFLKVSNTYIPFFKKENASFPALKPEVYLNFQNP